MSKKEKNNSTLALIISCLAFCILIITMWNVSYNNGKIGERFTALESTMDNDWICIQSECTTFSGPDVWIAKNCNPMPNGDQSCKVVIDGEEVYAPLSAINKDALQTCEEFICTVESKMREANYTL